MDHASLLADRVGKDLKIAWLVDYDGYTYK
jgi:hypothetical protein